MSLFHARGFERLIVSISISIIIGFAAYAGFHAFEIQGLLAILLSTLIVLSLSIIIARILPAELNGLIKRKSLVSVLWFFITILSIVQLGRLSIFMTDNSQTQYSLFPWNKWLIEHCCLTAYSEAARFTNEEDKNIYDPKNYSDRKLSGFNVDLYHYPPPFLLLPLGARALTGGDFLNIRSLWFSLNLLSLIGAICSIIYRLNTKGKVRVIGMAPLVFLSMPVLAGLQMSNVQIMVVSLSITAMALLSRLKIAGGALLAMTSVGKIFPGFLVLYLLFKRRFHEAALIGVAALILFIVAFLLLGTNPFQNFINYELPRLSSGEAFSKPFSRAFPVARNMSPFGVPLKLGWLGVPEMTLQVGRVVSTVYLILLIGLTFWSARREPRSITEEVSKWISIICLASIASPFAPANYVLVPLIILVCINHEMFTPVFATAVWFIICTPFLIQQDAPFLIQALAYLPSQIMMVAVPAFILYKAGVKEKQSVDFVEISVEPLSD